MKNQKFAQSLSIAAVAAVLVLAAPRPAAAQWLVHDPFAITQNIASEAARYTQTLTNLRQQVTQIQNQIQEIQTIAAQYKTIKLSPDMLTQLGNDLTKLQQIQQEGQYISTEDKQIAKDFSATFPAYIAPTDYDSMYELWAANLDKSTGTAYRTAKASLTQAKIDATVIDKLSQSSDVSPTNALQAAQLGNQIASKTASQLTKLTVLMGTQTQSESTYFQTQAKNEQQSRLSQQKWFLDWANTKSNF